MANVLVVRGEARRELIEACEYYEEQRRGYGDRFADAVDRELALLLDFPYIGRAVSSKVRRRVLIDWPYSIIYVIRDDELLILAFAHHRRHPGYWQSRLR